MNLTAEISMYPLDGEYGSLIIAFIRDLRRQPGIEVVSNQMSTQVRGDYAAVTSALQACMLEAMRAPLTVVFVVKYLNAALDVAVAPRLD